MQLLSFLLAILFFPALVFAEQTLTFASEDGVVITADFYASKKDVKQKTLIILFHQAGSSRGEYKTIAPRLTQLGYDALAIDQRSGNSFAGVMNKTAVEADVGRNFIKALPDMRAAINYGHDKLNAERIIIWGSSYSASLSLVLAGRQVSNVDGVLSFSPGEYFNGKLSIKNEAKKISIPVFITAARNETAQWQPIIEGISADKTGFVPKGEGKHGSSALLSQDSEEYWQAVTLFLTKEFPVN